MTGASLVTLFGNDDNLSGVDDLTGDELTGVDEMTGEDFSGDDLAGADVELLGAIENDPELLGFVISTAVAGGIAAALPWIKKGFAAIKKGKGIKALAKKIKAAAQKLFKTGKKNAAKALQQSLDQTLQEVIAKPPTAEAAIEAKEAKADIAAGFGLSPEMFKNPIMLGAMGLVLVVGVGSAIAGRGRGGAVAAPVQQSGRFGY